MAKPNSLWITRTSQGYCLRYRTSDSKGVIKESGYLTPRDLLRPFDAGYVPFTIAIEKITDLPTHFYSEGVVVQIDDNAQLKIESSETRAFRAVVRKLESMAKEIDSRTKTINEASRVLQIRR